VASDPGLRVVPQVRALNVELPGEAFEPAVRLCSQSGQWQKAVSILEQAQAQGNVSGPTAVAVFTTLLREGQPKAALQLLKARQRLYHRQPDCHFTLAFLVPPCENWLGANRYTSDRPSNQLQWWCSATARDVQMHHPLQVSGQC
jgi:hypothetical protein